jgi:hypothetical protein
MQRFEGYRWKKIKLLKNENIIIVELRLQCHSICGKIRNYTNVHSDVINKSVLYKSLVLQVHKLSKPRATYQ